MRGRRQQSVLPTIVAMLLASLGVHLMLWPVGNQVMRWSLDGPPLDFGGGVMEVALLPSDASENLEPDEEEEARLAEEEKEELEAKGKLVNLDWLKEELPPESAEFLSEFNSRVARQTAAPRGKPASAAAGEPGDRPDATESKLQSPAPPTPNSSHALALKPTRAASDDGAGEGSTEPWADAAPDGSLSDPGRAASGGIPGLRGNPDAMRKTFGSSGSYDDLRGIDEGEETLLNSRRWKYASFFNRVRGAVAQHWHPEVIHASRDPEGRIYGTQTRVTRLRIILNPDGSLKRIRIETPAGVDYLDEEAIRAVRAAQPFNNPPPQLVDDNGLIEFDFGFIFEIRGGSRIFRYSR